MEVMKLKPFPISLKEYQELAKLQIKPRSDWHAVFSVNRREDVWPFITWKLTPTEKRRLVPKEFRLLHEIAGFVISNSKDEEGGRFFINRNGVYFSNGDSEPSKVRPMQIIEWKPDEPLPELVSAPQSQSQVKPLPITLAQLEERRWRFRGSPKHEGSAESELARNKE
ncbi:MAG: hypothetical protein ACLQHF_08240 [Terracidiphilus sp.]